MEWTIHVINTKDKFFVNSGMKIEVNVDMVLYNKEEQAVRLFNKFTGSPTPTKFSPQRVFESKVTVRDKRAFEAVLSNPIDTKTIKHIDICQILQEA